MKPLVSCGGCGQFHPKGFTGDCRDDTNRRPVEDPTVVVFRRWRSFGQTVIALFPEDTDKGMCGSFEHVGQHGLADYTGVIRKTTPATPEEYADLKRELESAPYCYALRVVKRRTPKRRV